MDVAITLLVAVLVVLIVALLIFAKKLHSLIEELRMHESRLEAQLSRMERADSKVADNLADSISRADAADDAVPGSSADAALRTGEQK